MSIHVGIYVYTRWYLLASWSVRLTSTMASAVVHRPRRGGSPPWSDPPQEPAGLRVQVVYKCTLTSTKDCGSPLLGIGWHGFLLCSYRHGSGSWHLVAVGIGGGPRTNEKGLPPLPCLSRNLPAGCSALSLQAEWAGADVASGQRRLLRGLYWCQGFYWGLGGFSCLSFCSLCLTFQGRMAYQN